MRIYSDIRFDESEVVMSSLFRGRRIFIFYPVRDELQQHADFLPLQSGKLFYASIRRPVAILDNTLTGKQQDLF